MHFGYKRGGDAVELSRMALVALRPRRKTDEGQSQSAILERSPLHRTMPQGCQLERRRSGGHSSTWSKPFTGAKAGEAWTRSLNGSRLGTGEAWTRSLKGRPGTGNLTIGP